MSHLLQNNLKISWNDHTPKTRILTALLCGFFINTVFIKDKNNYKISPDSFLKNPGSGTEILYNELVTINNKTSMSLCSKLSKSVRTLYSELPV